MRLSPYVDDSLCLISLQDEHIEEEEDEKDDLVNTELHSLKDSGDSETSECMICMDATANICLPCAHSFCEDCIKSWSPLPPSLSLLLSSSQPPVLFLVSPPPLSFVHLFASPHHALYTTLTTTFLTLHPTRHTSSSELPFFCSSMSAMRLT